MKDKVSYPYKNSTMANLSSVHEFENGKFLLVKHCLKG
jgi:hypothetical protein